MSFSSTAPPAVSSFLDKTTRTHPFLPLFNGCTCSFPGNAGDLSPSVFEQTDISYPPTPASDTVPLRQKPSGAWTASSIHIAAFRGDSSLPPQRKMENAFARPADQVLSTLGVQASAGLTDAQVKKLTEKHGKNGRFASCRKVPGPRNADRSLSAIAEEPPTPLWELILEQFKDQLVLILLGSAAVSFVLALFEDEGGWSAFVDPAVVSLPPPCAQCISDWTGPDHPFLL